MLQTLPQLKKLYIDTGKVRYVFKDFPLPSHPNAHKAAEAARCAGVQDAYWEMHDRLFQSQREWLRQSKARVVDTFATYARDLGLDAPALRSCLESGQFSEQIAQDLREGKQAGVRGTPSFLIHGRLLIGAYPFDAFQQIIEAELEKAQ